MEVVMLSAFFERSAPGQTLRSGPFGLQLEGFAEYLWQCGYSRVPARRHLRSAEHFAHWATGKGLSPGSADADTVLRFGAHLPRCKCGRYPCADRARVVVGARLFVDLLQGEEQPTVRLTGPLVWQPPLLEAFCEWMRKQRGTTDATLRNYSLPIKAFIERADLDRLDARCVREFALEYSRSAGWGAAKRCTTALRMFLRFLVSEGRCPASLLGAIPTLAHWRLGSMPRCMPPDDVERLIATCDTSRAVGRRDRAILLLLARLGLRAGDIVHLRLQDIDWKGAWIYVCGKSRQQVRLPLSQEVGQAIVAYIQDGRPPSCSDAVFLRARAPFRALGSHSAVTVIVDSAIRRAGVKRPARGAAHLLRHSLASSMLRQGASLQDIATLLRHRSVETTQIYAKVDIMALTQIAQPWVEVLSC
jgi:site-specific recombinase XerD